MHFLDHHLIEWPLLVLWRAFATTVDTVAAETADEESKGPAEELTQVVSQGGSCDASTIRPKDPVRVLYIIDSLYNVGGAEACLLRMTKYMPRPDFECGVLTFHSAPESQWFVSKFDCPVHHWQLNNIYDWNALKVAYRLWRFIRDQKIDIVHTFFQTSDLWAGTIAKLAGARVHISSRRDMGILRKPKHELGYKLLRGVFDQVQTVSEGVRRHMIERDGLDPRRVLTVRTGIEPENTPSSRELDEIRRRLGLVPGSPVIITVANSRYVKGIDVLVRATAILAKEVPEVRVVVVGSLHGTPAERAYNLEMLKLSESLGVADRVQFMGKSDEVDALLRIGDIFVLPSRSEGMSNALLEAMRAQLPCVVTSVGGNPEAVADQESGFVVPSEDSEAMAGRILRLLRDPVLREEMGLASKKRWQEQFTVEKMISQLVESYYCQLALKNRSPFEERR
jgi:glycosyltransferase involved in cell wall biosynthesis